MEWSGVEWSGVVCLSARRGEEKRGEAAAVQCSAASRGAHGKRSVAEASEGKEREAKGDTHTPHLTLTLRRQGRRRLRRNSETSLHTHSDGG